MDKFSMLIVQTGGTIDKAYPKTIGGYNFEITDSAVKRIIDRIKPAFQCGFFCAMKKDSQDITDEDRVGLCNIVSKAMCKKVLISHGTDTMIETARVIACNDELADKTIVLTGAFLPEAFKDSDADFNVGVVVGALQCLSSPGVYVSMNGVVYRWNHVRRDPDTGQFVRIENPKVKAPESMVIPFND